MAKRQSLRRLIVSGSGLLLGMLLFGSILMSRSAFGQTTTSQKGGTRATEAQCSLATLHGTYVFAAQGLLIMGKDRVPFAFAGQETYDGHGHVHGIASESVDGQITRHVHMTGTVIVNPDCTTTETDKDETGALSHYDEFTTPDGSRIAGFATDQGVILSATAWRGTGE